MTNNGHSLDSDVTSACGDDERDFCIACFGSLLEGDPVYWSADDIGYLHAECCGPEREGYVNQDGEALKEGEPIPAPFTYRPDKLTEALNMAREGRYTVNEVRRTLGLDPVAHGEMIARVGMANE